MLKHKILMISPVWTGMKKYFLEGKETTEGMPAFANTLTALLAGGYEIHFILISESPINPPHVKGLFAYHCYVGAGRKGIFLAAFRAFKMGLQLARRHRFSLIYGHGSYGAVAGLLSLILRIPNVRRLYGTFLYPEVEPGTWRQRIKVAARHPLEYLAFTLPAAGVIITNDGTKGGEVARMLGCPPDKICFWLNGVNKDLALNIDQQQAIAILKKYSIKRDRPLIVSISRLEPWKRLDRAVRCLKHVTHTPSPLLIIGGYGSQMANLKKLADEEGVAKNTIFPGALNHEEALYLFNASDISLFLYDVTNRCNTLIEAMALGKCIMSINDGSLDGIITNGDNGILVDKPEPEAIADKLDELLQNTELRNKLGARARESAMQIFETWEERMNKELNMIASIISRSKV
ncbi:MAG: glycosyltransferase family 4 protein [Dehalococcoidia bacterium]|nr:glycosyltransferase family 4 protein [Dehalococcoidia bacterium]